MQQFNLHMTGSLTVRGLVLPMAMDLSLVRIGRNAAIVMMLDMKPTVGSTGRQLTDAQVERRRPAS